MTTKYDSSKFRVLGVGERVEKGDYYITPIMADAGREPKECLTLAGLIVGQDDDWTYLRPIEAARVPYDERPADDGQAEYEASYRKSMPVATGVLDYFPNAIRAVANCSYVGNEQHNPGSPMHWDRTKSGDEADALMRHFMERGTVDTDGILHSTKVAWRALAMLQKELEERQ